MRSLTPFLFIIGVLSSAWFLSEYPSNETKSLIGVGFSVFLLWFIPNCWKISKKEEIKEALREHEKEKSPG